MVKSELIDKIARQKNTHNLTHHDIELGINSIIERMTLSLCEEDRIEIRGFGSFCCHVREPRLAHNPKTGEPVQTNRKLVPHFKPGKQLRENINESRNNCHLQEATSLNEE